MFENRKSGRAVTRQALAVVCSLVLAACGGGGGAGGSEGGGGGGGETGSTTGFVPTPPALGDTLYAQAASLRPLRDGSRYVYRSRDYTVADSPPTETVVLQQDAADGAVTETDSSSPDEPQTLSVDGATGAVRFATSLILATGAVPVPIQAVELPSPVRQGAQVTVFDQRLTDTGIDVDADSRSDAVDLAVWRRVIGNEAVSLPNMTAQVAALRVDTFLKARVMPSAGGDPIDIESRVSTWYMPDVGIVRQVTVGTEGRTYDSEDLLLGYDGVVQGFGYVVQPAIGLGRSAAGGLVSTAVRSGDEVLAYDGTGHVFRLDRSGRLLSDQLLPIAPSRARLLPMASGVRLLSGSFPTYSMYQLRADGSLASPDPVVFDLSGGRSTTSSESEALIDAAEGVAHAWLVWERDYSPTVSSSATEIVLRTVNAEGQVLNAEVRLPVNRLLVTGSLRLAASTDGSAFVTWQETDTGSNVYNRWVAVAASGTVRQDFTQGRLNEGANGTDSPVWAPVPGVGTAWATWAGPDGAGGEGLLHLLVPGGAPVPPAALQAAVLGAAGGFDERTELRLWGVSGTRLFTTGIGRGDIDTGVPFLPSWVLYTELDMSTDASAAQAPALAQYRIPLPATNFMPPPVVFDDRVLLFTDNGDGFQPTVVWRR